MKFELHKLNIKSGGFNLKTLLPKDILNVLVSTIVISDSKGFRKCWGLTVFLATFLIIFSPQIGITQESPYKTRLSLSCTQLVNGTAELQAKLLARVNKKYQPVNQAEISFSHLGEDENAELGTATTNDLGLATLRIKGISEFGSDDEGYVEFISDYEGNDVYTPSDGDVMLREVQLVIETEIIDSVNTISLTISDEDVEDPELEDMEVQVLIPRFLSNLMVAEAYTDEDGFAEMEVPNDIPGDKSGNLDIIVRIPDTDEYGNIEARINEAWGVPKKVVEFQNRQLWSANAPLWLVITFIVLLVVIWSHFIHIIYELFNIKKERKLVD
jgi:hypothetical protein